MRKSVFGLLPLLLIPLLIVSIDAQETENTANTVIPDWVRPIAGWWSERLIEDQEFAEALKFLIEGEIIQIDSVPIKSKMAAEEVDTTDWEHLSKVYQGDVVTYQGEITRLEKLMKEDEEKYELEKTHLIEE